MPPNGLRLKPLNVMTKRQWLNFLKLNIFSRFGCPQELISDEGTHFVNDVIELLTEKYKMKHRLTTPYHLRANGQTEKSNGILCKIITKTFQGSMVDWDVKLLDALWAYRTAYEVTTKFTPFQLVKFMDKRQFYPLS